MSEIVDAFRHACDYWSAGRLHAAFRLFLKAAKEGDTSAQLNLAHFYSQGLGVRRNARKELHWLQKAADKGCASAASNIGIICLETGKSYAKIIAWLSLAGQLGDGDAYYELGRFFLRKLGDVERAKHYLLLAISASSVTDASVEEAEVLLAGR
jgi:TPR repeat protein